MAAEGVGLCFNAEVCVLVHNKTLAQLFAEVTLSKLTTIVIAIIMACIAAGRAPN